MSTAPATRHLTIVRCAATGQPRTLRLEPLARPAATRDAAYRRLATVILGLDVATLAHDLRLGRQRRSSVDSRAA